MKRLIRSCLAAALLVAGSAGTAPAQPPPEHPVSTNLSWDHCAGDGQIVDHTFACDTNTGTDVLVLSMVLHDSTRTGVVSWDAMIDVTPVAGTVPSWWGLAQGMCRQNAMIFQADWSYESLPPTSCLPWYGGSTVLFIYGFHYGAPDRFFVQVQAAVPSPETRTCLAETEYQLCRIKISHSRTTGSGACTGCTVPTCIGVGKLNLYYAESWRHDYFAGDGLNSVTWQGGYVASYPTQPRPLYEYEFFPHTNQLSCTTAPVPARGRTWGLIKTMYR